METVAHHLQVQAIERTDANERDLFGRASYNRYYYSMFLHVREAVESLDEKWCELPHADYPELLNGKVARHLNKERLRAQKIGDAESVALLSRGIAAAHAMAKLMRDGSAIRVVADYHPSIGVVFTVGGRFSLGGVSVTQAHGWLEQARLYTTQLRAAWKVSLNG